MPAGARMTSGFRSSSDQVEVIRQYARSHGVEVPAVMRAEEPTTWERPLTQLRALGLIIAAPGKSPHTSEEVIVMDWAGANLGEIRAACLSAEAKGLVRVRRTIEESKNHALHVELELTASGCEAVGISCETATVPPAGSARASYLDSLREEHDRAKGDLERQIALDRKRKEFTDQDKYDEQRALDADIAQHQADLERLNTEHEKKEALDQINLAKQRDTLDIAVELAERYANDVRFRDDPNAKSLLAQIRLDQLLERIGDLLYRADCEAYAQAREMIESAAEDEQYAKAPLQRIRKEVELRLSNCRAKNWLRWVLAGIGVCVVLGGIYLAFRQHYVIEIIAGPNKGRVFTLKQNEIVIGSVGLAEENGELTGADIVLDDTRQHISREHCRVERVGRKFYLTDLSSTGTTLNQVKLTKGQAYLLQAGDEILLADAAELLFRCA